MDKLYRYGWMFMIVAMAGDIIVSIVLPLFNRGYEWTKISISALGNPASPVRLIYNPPGSLCFYCRTLRRIGGR